MPGSDNNGFTGSPAEQSNAQPEVQRQGCQESGSSRRADAADNQVQLVSPTPFSTPEPVAETGELTVFSLQREGVDNLVSMRWKPY